MTTFYSEQVGAVVIGRNEGERLRICLNSLVKCVRKVVYVDSGSTDNSVEIAQKLGVSIVELDMALPFTAARARNSGFEFLKKSQPDLDYVQFIDGDCELVPGWLEQAISFMQQHREYAIVCGRRRERYPEKSIYNQLCDIEWNTSIGDSKACGGDALIRLRAFQLVAGYKESLIAGEEPELCIRLRQAGWKIYRLDAEMTLHDAAITRFWQWWKRSQRAGYAFAEGAYLHGRSPEKHRIRETLSAFIWGFIIPVLLLILSFINQSLLVGWLVYLLQIFKVAIKKHKLISTRSSFFYACFVMLAKFPQFYGIIDFLLNKRINRVHKLIEYK